MPDLSWLLYCVIVSALPQLVLLILFTCDTQSYFSLLFSDAQYCGRSFALYTVCMFCYGGSFIAISMFKVGLIVLIVCGTQVFVLPSLYFLFVYRGIYSRTHNGKAQQKQASAEFTSHVSYARVKMSSGVRGTAYGVHPYRVMHTSKMHHESNLFE